MLDSADAHGLTPFIEQSERTGAPAGLTIVNHTACEYPDPASLVEEAADDEECCVGACAVKGEEKYFSIDTKHNMCGECCMNPADYNKYKIFEPGLTKADDDSPCGPLGFPTYDSTVTHGFGNIKMTLDLYDPAEEAGLPV